MPNLPIRSTVRAALGAVALAAAVTLGAPQATAQTPEARIAKAERILELSLEGDMAEQMVEAMTPLLEAQAKQEGGALTPEQRSGIIAIAQEETIIMMKDLAPQFAQVYAANLSDGELDALLAFYESEEGRSAMRAMPAMMQQISQVIAAQMPAVMTRMQPRILKVIEEGRQ